MENMAFSIGASRPCPQEEQDSADTATALKLRRWLVSCLSIARSMAEGLSYAFLAYTQTPQAAMMMPGVFCLIARPRCWRDARVSPYVQVSPASPCLAHVWLTDRPVSRFVSESADFESPFQQGSLFSTAQSIDIIHPRTHRLRSFKVTLTDRALSPGVC